VPAYRLCCHFIWQLGCMSRCLQPMSERAGLISMPVSKKRYTCISFQRSSCPRKARYRGGYRTIPRKGSARAAHDLETFPVRQSSFLGPSSAVPTQQYFPFWTHLVLWG
jgi:hypothetical protein